MTHDQATAWPPAGRPAPRRRPGSLPGLAAGLSRRARPGAGIVTRAAGPRVPLLAGNGAGVWVVLLIGWGLAAAAWLAWLAARIAAALAGRRMPSFSERWVISLARWRTSQAWPGTPTILVVLIAIVLACAASRPSPWRGGSSPHASRGRATRWPRSPSTRRSRR